MTTTTTQKAIKEFTISRTFNAPRLMVWKVWTEVDHLQQWFGPKGVKIEHANLDFRTGGTYHFMMRTPDGVEMWGRWRIEEIVPPEKLVWVNSFSDSQGGITRHPLTSDPWPLELHTVVTFEEQGNQTLVTVRWKPINATAEEITLFNQSHASMQQGWSGTFERLEGHLIRL